MNSILGIVIFFFITSNTFSQGRNFNTLNLGQIFKKLVHEEIESGDKCISTVNIFKCEIQNLAGESVFPQIRIHSEGSKNWVQKTESCNLILLCMSKPQDTSILDDLYSANMKQKQKLVVLNIFPNASSIAIENHGIFQHLLFSIIISQTEGNVEIKTSEFAPEFHWKLIPPFDTTINLATLFPTNKLYDMKGNNQGIYIQL